MTSYDLAWLDRAYNNRALVPEHAQIFERWARDSAQVRKTRACELDIPYGNGPLEKLDVFPGKRADAPVVVFIHGGYWRSLDKADHSFLVPTLALGDACVVVVNYALCPAVTIPDIVLQTVQALLWTYRNIHRWGGRARHLDVVGHSAGGHLAAMLLNCQWKQLDADLPQQIIRRALSISGLFDLDPVMHVPYLKESLRITPSQVKMASPALQPAPRQGVLHTVVGAVESPEFMRHNQLIAQSWGQRAVPVCQEIAGCNHFTVLDSLITPGAQLNHIWQQFRR